MRCAGLRFAITLLTAVPLPGGRAAATPPSRQTAAAALYWAPAVGFVLGAVAGGVLLLANRIAHVDALLAAVLAIAVLVAATRALHLDGLADTADGLGSRRPAHQALEIMKRSDIGPFGVVTVVLALMVQVSALAEATQNGRGPTAIVAAAVAGRLAIMLACRRGVPAARSTGLGALVAGTVRPAGAVIIVLAALGAAAAAGWIFVIAIALALVCSQALLWLAVRRFGGITGDVLGAIAELAASACLLVTAIS